MKLEGLNRMMDIEDTVDRDRRRELIEAVKGRFGL